MCSYRYTSEAATKQMELEMNGYYFEVRKAVNGQFFFRFRGANHETIVVSETYTARSSCDHAINLLKAYAAGATIKDHTALAA